MQSELRGPSKKRIPSGQLFEYGKPFKSFFIPFNNNEKKRMLFCLPEWSPFCWVALTVAGVTSKASS